MAFLVAVAEGDTNNQSVPVNRNVEKVFADRIYYGETFLEVDRDKKFIPGETVPLLIST
jgi:hypothetical protein